MGVSAVIKKILNSEYSHKLFNSYNKYESRHFLSILYINKLRVGKAKNHFQGHIAREFKTRILNLKAVYLFMSTILDLI